MKKRPLSRMAQRLQHGVTLVELLVAMVIGLVVTLAVTSIITVGESHRRSTTSTNDVSQSGAFATYVIDRAVRSAGSGFLQSWAQGSVGCKMHAASYLPRTDAFPAPFKNKFLLNATANLRLAPVLIGKSQSDSGSDVLVVMAGHGASGDVPRRLPDPGDANTLALDTALGFTKNDVLLVSQAGVPDCLFEQVDSVVPPQQLKLGGTYYTAGTSTTIASLANNTSSYVTVLGNTDAKNLQFQLYGVGANQTLFSYDLLRMDDSDPDVKDHDKSQALADGVAGLYAIYGIDTNHDGILDHWADPGATGYDIETVMTTQAKLREIVAVRVALVLRSNSRERDPVAPAKLELFAHQTDATSTALKRELTLTESERHYRHRVIESTIPVRNVLMLPAL